MGGPHEVAVNEPDQRRQVQDRDNDGEGDGSELGSRRAIHQRIALDEQGETCPEHAADVGNTLAAKAK
ncbi:hypothetical protein ASV07_18800 [Enterobacter roggenkampii]|nr:hypothetical protein ASV07_18800 [Enterobacter roggenkampii]